MVGVFGFECGLGLLFPLVYYVTFRAIYFVMPSPKL